MSCDTRKLVFPVSWHRSDTNQPLQSQKKVRILKFWVEVDQEELYYLSSENKGADHLCSYCEADLRLCFLHRFSHNAAEIMAINIFLHHLRKQMLIKSFHCFLSVLRYKTIRMICSH